MTKDKYEIESKIENCCIICSKDPSGNLFYKVVDAEVRNKEGEVVFEGDLIIANLDGYAILPKDQYKKDLAGSEPVRGKVV